MRKVFSHVVVAVLASGSIMAGQAADVSKVITDANKVLAEVRQALGGEKKLAGVKTLSATGRATRVNGDTSMPPTDFEMAMELPDKYVRKDVVATLGNATITRTSGFNGSAPIDVVDTPPAMPGMVFFRGPGGPTTPGMQPTPEQAAEARKASLRSSRQDFARLTLGMFAASFDAYPLQFAYAGQAESPDGKADVIDVTGPDEFALKLFTDAGSHLPLMLSWMAKEPLQMIQTNRAGGAPGAGSGMTVMQNGGGRAPTTPEDSARMLSDLQERMKEAEAKRRVVEYRLYYSDYQDISGVKIPMRLQRSIDGKPVEELTLEKVKVNAKIDPKKFDAASGGF